MASVKFLGIMSVGTVLAAVSIAALAGPASKSPFANKKPKAWETQTQTTTQPIPQTKWQQPATNTYQAPQYQTPQHQVPQYQAPQYQAPKSNPQAGGAYYPGKKSAWQTQNSQTHRPQVNRPQVHRPQVSGPQTAPAVQVPAWANKTYEQRRQSGQTQQLQNQQYQGQQVQGQLPAWTQKNQNAQNQTYQPAYRGMAQNQAQQQAPVLRGTSNPYGSKPSRAQRLGFGHVQTTLNGHAKIGIAAMDRNDAGVAAEAIFDFDVRGEVSAITDGGLEYGAGLRVRAQRDRFRRGFGGRVGDCPPGIGDCASVLVGANTRTVKGHTSQFYTAGPGDTRDTAIGLEGAYLFLRSSYGDFVIGRDDGSAYLFSVGAPSLVAVNASNSPVDYTGLDSVKTYNDASGFAEKIAYTSPRLLGDNVGVGVQIGLSYAPNARACGVDYCVKRNSADPLTPFAPEIENIFELGVALDRKFSNGLSAELTGTYARGNEASGLAIFDDLESYGLGLELKYGDFVFGTSYLNSNNGFSGQGDYTAYDAGLTWKPSKWGFTASYGYADDDIAKLTSNQGVLAVSYDLGKIRLGTGVQYISRNVPVITPGGRDKRRENAAALFIEAGMDF